MTKKQIAIVTGGAGFIGSHMVDLLIENNFEVRVIDDLSGGHLENLNQHKNNTNLVAMIALIAIATNSKASPKISK